MRDTIEMAREAGAKPSHNPELWDIWEISNEALKRLVALARADEREASQAPVQEPVAYQLRHPNVNFGNWYTVDMERHRRATKDFERRELVVANTSPPAPQPVPVKTYHDGKPWPVAPMPWVGLTDEEMQVIEDNCLEGGSFWDVYRTIEAKLKEKNHDQ